MSDWIKVYSSSEIYKCYIVKSMFDEYNIAYNELNKKDSAYVMMGEMEIYVPLEDQIFARLLITQNNLE